MRAVRVLVDDVKDCYAALGIVHNLWSPIAEEFDDYIAKPKSNNYRSLHTAVIGPDGKPVEIQIRTFEMHQHSELGVAAHWRYKEDARHDRGYDEKIAWLRQVLEWKDEVSDAGELAEQLKTGLFADTIYVLTPQGRVIDLPEGSTPIDFAYHVHTELGHRCRGAKVDGAIVPLNTPLTNGQRVEILAAKQGGPSRDWLNPALGFLKSQGARTKVRQWFNRQNHEADVIHGRALLEKELHRHGRTALNLDKLAADLGYERLDDFLVDIARGGSDRSSCRSIEARAGRTRARGNAAADHAQTAHRGEEQRARRRRRQAPHADGQMLQAGAARPHRRFRHPWPRRHGAPRRLRQSRASRRRAADRGRMGRGFRARHSRWTWHWRRSTARGCCATSRMCSRASASTSPRPRLRARLTWRACASRSKSRTSISSSAC